MAKDGERGRDRAAEAFAALSARPRAQGAAPWRVASVLLLLLAAGLAVTLLVRDAEEKRAARERARAADAQADLALVRWAEGDLPGAVRELGKTGGRPAVVQAAIAVSEDVDQALDRLRAAEAEREARGERLERMGEASRSILEGKPTDAIGTLGFEEPGPAPEGYLFTLAHRVWQLDEAFAVAGDVRAASLRNLSARWPLAALEVLRAEDQDRRMEAVRRAAALERAAEAVAAERPTDARAALVEAVTKEVSDLYGSIARIEMRGRAESLEADGDTEAAAALWSVYSLTYDEGQRDRAHRLAEAARRDRIVAYLEAETERRLRAEDYEAVGAFVDALGGVTGADATGARDSARAVARLRRARDLRAAGALEAALVLAREADELGNPAARPLTDEIAGELARAESRARVERAWKALSLGAGAFAQAEIEGREPPADLRSAIASALAAEDRRAAEIELREGDMNMALARFPEGDRRRLLLATAVQVFAEDAMRASALAARAAELGEEGLLGLLIRAEALEGTDRAPDAHAMWVEIRDRALAKAPLPEEDTAPGDREN